MTTNQTTLSQIRRMDLLAISGGRVVQIDDKTISLPVHYGYSVEIEYQAGRDLYEVRRILKRGAKRFDKGTVTGVYAEDLSETAYQASCFQNVDFGH